MIKILLVDDHPIVREGIIKILHRQQNIETVAEAETSKEAMALLRESQFNVVILDISLPDKSGLLTLEQIKHDYPDLPVLMLSMYPEEEYAIQSLKSGASGYLTKKALPGELLKAIAKIATGGKYITPTLAEKLANEIDTKSDKPLYKYLTKREVHIMDMIVTGKTPKEIADMLNLSVRTINTYRGNILEKLQLKNNAELVRYAIENNLFHKY
ncbi:MAG: response regulator transcription factor [Nitrospirae bacterium]|nr:response regulator transcription factor [Nitrospirota bacterium]MBF0592997.1 response regulator transcription factor [Nitrospirota bacterium]